MTVINSSPPTRPLYPGEVYCYINTRITVVNGIPGHPVICLTMPLDPAPVPPPPYVPPVQPVAAPTYLTPTAVIAAPAKNRPPAGLDLDSQTLITYDGGYGLSYDRNDPLYSLDMGYRLDKTGCFFDNLPGVIVTDYVLGGYGDYSGNLTEPSLHDPMAILDSQGRETGLGPRFYAIRSNTNYPYRPTLFTKLKVSWPITTSPFTSREYLYPCTYSYDANAIYFTPVVFWARDTTTINPFAYNCFSFYNHNKRTIKYDRATGYFSWVDFESEAELVAQNVSNLASTATLAARMTVDSLRRTYPKLAIDWIGFEQALIANTAIGSIAPDALEDIITACLESFLDYSNCQYMPYMPTTGGPQKAYLLEALLFTGPYTKNLNEVDTYNLYKNNHGGILKYQLDNPKLRDPVMFKRDLLLWEKQIVGRPELVSVMNLCNHTTGNFTPEAANWIDNYVIPALFNGAAGNLIASLVTASYTGTTLDIATLRAGLINIGATKTEIQQIIARIPISAAKINLTQAEVTSLLSSFTLVQDGVETISGFTTFVGMGLEGILYVGGVAVAVTAGDTEADVIEKILAKAGSICAANIGIQQLVGSGLTILVSHAPGHTTPLSMNFVPTWQGAVTSIEYVPPTAEQQWVETLSGYNTGSVNFGGVIFNVTPEITTELLYDAIIAASADIIALNPTIATIKRFVDGGLEIMYTPESGNVPLLSVTATYQTPVLYTLTQGNPATEAAEKQTSNLTAPGVAGTLTVGGIVIAVAADDTAATISAAIMVVKNSILAANTNLVSITSLADVVTFTYDIAAKNVAPLSTSFVPTLDPFSSVLPAAAVVTIPDTFATMLVYYYNRYKEANLSLAPPVIPDIFSIGLELGVHPPTQEAFSVGALIQTKGSNLVISEVGFGLSISGKKAVTEGTIQTRFGRDITSNI